MWQCLSPMTEIYTQSKAYLLPLSGEGAQFSAMKSNTLYLQKKARAFLFDAGATVAGVKSTTDSKDWSGTEWIYKWYEDRGIVFDEVHAWEPTKQEVDLNALPAGLAKVLHFNNVGITSDPNSRHNPVALIRKLCKPEDIVVFKLDIDNAMEMQVMKQLLTSDEMMGLVDEFYFEHHVHNPLMRMHGLGGIGTKATNLKSWYNMAIPARRKGLRMHFWP